MRFRRTRRNIETLELTPLIDVIFQLLIFFLITTTFVSAPGISIERPKAKHSGPLDQQRMTVVIPKEGEGSVLYNGKRMSYGQLAEVLSKQHKKTPDAQIAIDADENVEHRIVVKVMDLIEGTGFKRIGIVTSPAPDKK